jgi:hypothetical protein
VRGSGATSASRPATAEYLVVFNRNVSACAFQAVIDPGSPGAPASAQGFAHSTGASGNTSAVSVFTYAGTGTHGPANRPFTLAVFC